MCGWKRSNAFFYQPEVPLCQPQPTRTQSFHVQMCSVIFFYAKSSGTLRAEKNLLLCFCTNSIYLEFFFLLLAQTCKTLKNLTSLKWTKIFIDLQQNFAQWVIALGSIHIAALGWATLSLFFFSPNAARAISENAFNYWMACKKGINIVDRSLSQIARHSIYTAVAKAFL